MALQIFSPSLLNDDYFSSDEDEPRPKPTFSHEAMVKFNEMRVSNQLCDAVIKTSDGTAFNVHRTVIGACSEYFRTLFTTPLTQYKNETLLMGVSTAAMHLVIEYAYQRDCSKIGEKNVYEMLFVSDYLGILGLLKFCIEFIINTLSTENCIIIWLMSRYRCIIRLRDKSWNFILENFERVAVESKSMVELKVDDLHTIIDDKRLNIKDESSAWECVIRWIKHKPEKRKGYLAKLMRAVKLGLLPNQYFMEQVKKNEFVEKDPEAKPIIIETMRFLNDLDALPMTKTLKTPDLAVPRLPHEIILAVGGWSEGAPQTYIESYDSRADRWVRVFPEDPAGPRSYHGTAVIGTKVYCVGGFNGTDYFNTCTRFDASKRQWKEIAPMHSRRCYVSVASLDGMIYALGGYDGSHRQNTGERYCPKTNQWTMISPMHFQRSDADACAHDGKIFVTGGFNGQECLNTAEYYTPETNSWTMLVPMLNRRSGVSCVIHSGQLYVIGGFNGLSRMNSGERYDPSTRTWTTIKEMYHPRSNFGLEIIDDMIMAIGGFNGVQTISHCEFYVPGSDEWIQATDMSIIRSALTSNRVRGLANILDYIHLDRQNLAEDSRRRLFEAANRTLAIERVLPSLSSFFMHIDMEVEAEEDPHIGDDTDNLEDEEY